jgi:hypothetical protein
MDQVPLEAADEAAEESTIATEDSSVATEAASEATEENPVAHDTAATKVTVSASTTLDADLIRQGEDLFSEEQYFRAAEALSKVSDRSLLESKQEFILQLASQGQAMMQELLTPNPEDSGWKKQGESHGHRDTMIHYKVHDDNSLLCRIETPIESSLLLPLVSVLNESDLYETWMPSWRFPRLGVKKSAMLAEMGRGHQVVQVVIQMPFPFCDRECIQHAFAVDSIDQDNAIVIKIKNLDTGKHFEDAVDIPEADKGVKRIDFEAGMLIRACPPDHHLLENSKGEYPAGEKLLLLTLVQQVDAHVSGIPLSLVNFFTRTVLGQFWGSLLQVAEGVRDGKRPLHKKAIEGKTELYGWIDDRIKIMFDKIDKA